MKMTQPKACAVNNLIVEIKGLHRIQQAEG